MDNYNGEITIMSSFLDEQRLVDHTRAIGRHWRNRPSIPDPLSYEDVLHDAYRTASVVRDRAARHFLVGEPQTFPFPKESPTAPRDMVRLDPYADIAFRSMIQPAATRISLGLADSVIQTRPASGTRGPWTARNLKQSFNLRNKLMATYRQDPSLHGYGTLDIKSHFPTIGLGLLETTLNSVAVPAGTVEAILNFVAELHHVPGMPAGLPIGPEASGPLGTLALIPLDRLLEAAGITNFRWVDDIFCFVADVADFHMAAELVRSQAIRGGQAINEAKVNFHYFDKPHPTTAVSGGTHWIDQPDLLDALSLQECIDTEEFGPFKVKLGGMRYNNDAGAIDVILANPILWERIPRQTAEYLESVAYAVPSWDPIKQIITSETTRSNAAGQVHALRILPDATVGKRLGLDLFDRGQSLPRREFGPARCWYGYKASRSEIPSKKRMNLLLEAAEATPDLNEQRVLVGSLRNVGGLPPIAKDAVQHLARRTPELEPTALWVLN